MYTTTLLCTGVSRPPLAYSPPIPIIIDSPMGELVGAEQFGQGKVYALGTGSLETLVRRNYEPHTWRITGTITCPYYLEGWMTAPLSDDTPDFTPVEFIESFEFDSGPDPSPPTVMPDFAIVPRKIAEYSFHVEHIVQTYFPAGQFPNNEIRSGYWVQRYTIAVEIRPYSWEQDGTYYLEQQCTVSLENSLRVGPGTAFSEVSPEEGVTMRAGEGLNSAPGVTATLSVKGGIIVRDPLMPPIQNWGSIDLWGPDYSIEVTSEARCTRHYL